MNSKRCTNCGKTKLLSEFSKHSLTKDGFAYWCKACHRERTRLFRLTPSGIYSQLKGRQAFFKKKPVIMSRGDFIIWYKKEPKKCHYCNIVEADLYLFAKRYGSRYSRLTVDCKDNDAGYISGNLVLACDKCNITKNNMLTFDEMMYVGQNFIKPKWQSLKKLGDRRTI